MKNTGHTILVGITGSIAAYRALEVIRALKKKGFCVACVMTREAQAFVTPLSVRTLAQEKVYCDMFEEPEEWKVEHVSLAQRAEAIVIVPATANIIAKIAHGICDDLLTCTVLASQAKKIIVPAMDEVMYTSPQTQENIARLKGFGYAFIGPKKGTLASGKEGLGHIEDPSRIVEEVEKLF
jgi:phosphopantothenoylcysteine decarboxylase/phosphopantothenate--cysteine ligase